VRQPQMLGLQMLPRRLKLKEVLKLPALQEYREEPAETEPPAPFLEMEQLVVSALTDSDDPPEHLGPLHRRARLQRPRHKAEVLLLSSLPTVSLAEIPAALDFQDRRLESIEVDSNLLI
jgi:hypothetical protein